MTNEPVVSVVIPSRNEPYLQPTINNLLSQARGEIEIIVVLDGYWPDPPLEDNDRVHIIHRGESRGLRNAVTSAVNMAKGKYIFKVDAHCTFDEGYDVKLVEDCEPNWVVVPRRYPLDVEKFQIEERKDNKYPIDYMYLTYPYAMKNGEMYGLHGKEWGEKNATLKDVLIDDLLTAQGSAYFLHKDYFHELELLDEETYGSFRDEFLEVGMKCWLSGGRVVVNKKTWYSHWHKNKGRGYTLPNEGSRWEIWMKPNAWHKQTLPLQFILDKFPNMPGWESYVKPE